MSNIQKAMNHFARFLFGILLIGISLKQIQESNNLVKTVQDNISEAKNILYSMKIYNLGFLYRIAPRLVLIMNYSLLASAFLFLLKIDGYIALVNNSFIIPEPESASCKIPVTIIHDKK